MEFVEKEIDAETLAKVKSYDRIPFETFKALIASGQIKRTKKLKRARTIFFDEETQDFLYLNPVWKQLHKVGEFI